LTATGQGLHVKIKAKQNYLAGMSDQQNALECEVSRQTIISWRKKYRWDQDKIEIEERAREKFVDVESDRLASGVSAIDADHKDILTELRIRLKRTVLGGKGEDISELNALLFMSEKFIKLDREVNGLVHQSNLPRMTFPTAFNIKLQHGNKQAALGASELTKEQENAIFFALPNQNEEFYGSEEQINAMIDSEDDEEFDYSDSSEIPSLSL
jgi:hypothetical protein